MKKTILSIAIALITMIGFESFAQQPQTANCEKKEQCTSKGDWKKNRKQHHKLQRTNHDLFVGLELTAEQKEEILKIDNEARERNNKINQKENQDKQKVQNDYDKKMKKILTPEQYNKYLINKEKDQKNKVEIKKRFREHNKNVERISNKHKKDSLMQQRRHQKQVK